MRILLIYLMLSTTALAQEAALRDGEQTLSATDIAAQIVGQTLVFFDNGQAKFSLGGAYSYTYFEGGTSFGSFSIESDGVICITFQNGWSRCDKYIWSADRIVMVTDEGDRFPIR